jgi:hypothetical protein
MSSRPAVSVSTRKLDGAECPPGLKPTFRSPFTAQLKLGPFKASPGNAFAAYRHGFQDRSL